MTDYFYIVGVIDCLSLVIDNIHKTQGENIFSKIYGLAKIEITYK